MTGWISVAVILVWTATPLAVTVVGAIISAPSRSALQQTPKLLIAIGLVPVVWMAAGLVVLLPLLHRWIPLKILLSFLAWFVVTAAGSSLWLFDTWVCSVSSPEEFPTSFKVEGSYRRQANMRALDGPAAGRMFAFNTDVVDSAEQLEPQNTEVRVGVVRQVRLGLWRATLNN